jgi:hypothetical protein
MSDGSSKIKLIAQMRETFPGVGLLEAKRLIEGIENRSVFDRELRINGLENELEKAQLKYKQMLALTTKLIARMDVTEVAVLLAAFNTGE